MMRNRKSIPSRSRHFHTERLEPRCLLSVSSPNFPIRPTYQFYSRHGQTRPATSSSPTGLSPAQLSHSYGLDNILLNTGLTADGTGQTVAIIDAYDNPKFVSSSSANYNTSDLYHFNQQFGLPQFGAPGGPTFTKVNQSGGTTYPAGSTGWGDEIALDVEIVHALAPGANILLVEATTNSTTNLITQAAGWARGQAGVSVVTMSFGGGEFSGETNSSNDGKLTTPVGHNGVTFIASTGDSGAGAQYPAVSPNVLAVGGTTLSLSGNNYVSETAWTDSGGGISSKENKPTYQSSVTQSSNHRTVPDVAFDADPNSGLSVYDSYSQGNATPWVQIGGTSLAAPAWAAIIAMVDQVRVTAGLTSLNGKTQLLPQIYAMPQSDFHDITSGSNGFSAGAGYDLVTGRGTPIGQLVISDLLVNAPTPPDLAAATDTGISSTDNLTKIAAPEFTGLAPVGSTVQILADGNVVGSGVATGGIYDITISSPLSDGQHGMAARIGATTSPGTLAVMIDTVAPTVTAATFLYDTGHAVTFSFAENVSNGLTPPSATITSIDDSNDLVTGSSYSTPSNVATFTLPISMNDGNYVATLAASSVIDAAGNSMAADYAFGFFVLAGDANHDGVVDMTDIYILSQNWLGSGKTFSQGDFNYDGTVDARDLGIIATHWQ